MEKPGREAPNARAMHIDDTDDILAALDKTHARLAQSVSGVPPAAADEPATWEDLLAREPTDEASLTLGAAGSTDPTFPSALGAPVPAVGRSEDGLVGTKQYNSADLLAAFDTASAGPSAAVPQPTFAAPLPGGRGEDGLVGTKQYNSADLLAAFDTASAGGGAAEQQIAATATQGAVTATPHDRQRAALLCEEAANHRGAAATLRQAARQQLQMVAVLGDEAAQREGLVEGAASQEQAASAQLELAASKEAHAHQLCPDIANDAAAAASAAAAAAADAAADGAPRPRRGVDLVPPLQLGSHLVSALLRRDSANMFQVLRHEGGMCTVYARHTHGVRTAHTRHTHGMHTAYARHTDGTRTVYACTAGHAARGCWRSVHRFPPRERRRRRAAHSARG